MPLHAWPLCAAATPSPLKEAAVLLDQRHVVTRDREGAVLVWDVTTGAVVQRRVAASSLAEAAAQLFRPEAVPPWFTVSVESGACRRPSPHASGTICLVAPTKNFSCTVEELTNIEAVCALKQWGAGNLGRAEVG